jgi:hypothetical protein
MSCQTNAYLMCCSFVFSKCIECMIALFRQRAARGSWVCCRRSPWATTWWRQVSSTLLYPTYFIIHYPALHYWKLKDWLVCIYLILVYLFWVIMVSFTLLLYFNQWTWCEYYDTMMLSRWCSCDYFRGLRLFLEYLSVRTCLGSDNSG